MRYVLTSVHTWAIYTGFRPGLDWSAVRMCTVLPMSGTDTYSLPGPDDWLSIGEAASLLGLSVKTLRRYDESGRLRATRSPSGHRRYRRSQIDDVMNPSAA
jgi:excisionase family DNA binding protein